jgi:hypothetical protein
MKYTAEDRVSKGIQWLDGAAQRGKISPYWRNRINLKNLRIADWSKTIIGQLFDGDYQKGFRKIGLYIPFDGAHMGFVNYPRPYRDYTVKLRKAWENALKTDSEWKRLTVCSSIVYNRTINGVIYSIIPDVFSGSIVVAYTLAGEYHQCGPYKNIDSAKRAVRKLATK